MTTSLYGTSNLPRSLLFSFEGASLEVKRICKANMLNIWPVPMTQRSHLFPFRTQKLSSVVPKILGWRRPGKIGRRRLFSSLYFHMARWSSGQDGGLSRRKREFDSPTGHHLSLDKSMPIWYHTKADLISYSACQW